MCAKNETGAALQVREVANAQAGQQYRAVLVRLE